MLNLFGGIKKELIGMGLERVCSFYEFNVRLFSEKFKFIDLSEFCGKNPEMILGKIGNLINEIRFLRMFHGHFYEGEINENEGEWEMFSREMEAFEQRFNEEKIKSFEKNNKIKRIQTFIKKRVSKWYVLINSLLNKFKQKNI